MSKKADKDLLIMLRSPEKGLRNTALRVIYENSFPTIAALITKNSGSAQDAEDIFQDGLIAFFEQVTNDNFKGTSSIQTYLYAICRNLWWKRLRKSSTKKEVFGHDSDFVLDDALAIDNLIMDEESETLADLLEQLGESCKKVLLLFYYERKRMKEIASLLGFANEKVAKSKKNRCLNKLKDLAAALPHFKPFD